MCLIPISATRYLPRTLDSPMSIWLVYIPVISIFYALFSDKEALFFTVTAMMFAIWAGIAFDKHVLQPKADRHAKLEELARGPKQKQHAGKKGKARRSRAPPPRRHKKAMAKTMGQRADDKNRELAEAEAEAKAGRATYRHAQPTEVSKPLRLSAY